MTIETRILGPHDASVLASVANGEFDHPVNPEFAAEFLSDPRHHLVVALDGRDVVGFASAVHYIHPDKPPELWIDEVGVAPSHQNRGLGQRILQQMLELGARLGCGQAWVLTDASNEPAVRLYSSFGGAEAATPQIMFTFDLSKG